MYIMHSVYKIESYISAGVPTDLDPPVQIHKQIWTPQCESCSRFGPLGVHIHGLWICVPLTDFPLLMGL